MNFIKLDHELLSNEYKLIVEGFSFIAGVDEVGRGPLAGPVVAVALGFTDYKKIPHVSDSKQLSEKQRIELDQVIRADKSIKFAISEISVEEIDRINILQATHLAMRTALENLAKSQRIDFVLIDGNPVKSITLPNKSIVKGDRKSASIAAASIIAKVYRDNLMNEYHKIYPEYDFASHKGYGTKKHLDAIQKFGISPIHRKTFAPIKNIIHPPPEQFEFNF